jgi:CARDB
MKLNETKINVYSAAFAILLGLTMVASANSTTPAPLKGSIDPQAARQLPLPNFDPTRARLATLLPDLVVTRAHVTRTWQIRDKYRRNVINFCVKNIGVGAFSETSIVFANTIVGDTGSPPRPSGGGDSLADLGRYLTSVPTLAPTQEHCDSFAFLTKGETHNGPMFFNASTNARLIVDRSRRIAEINESNNETSTLVTFSAP